MKVLVTGANGQLGYSLRQTVPEGIELIACARQQLDLADVDAMAAVLTSYRPDAIINAAAYTAVDKAESERDLAFAINAEAVRGLADYCQQESISLLQVSTDFVFAGDSSSPYLPESQLQPLGVYGESKLAGEGYAQDRCSQSYIVRTGWVYCEHGSNFVKTMLRLAAERDSLGVIADQIGTPTYARNLAEALWGLLIKRADFGVYHFSDAGVASWYDFAVAIFEEASAAGMLAAIPQVKPIGAQDYPTPARRPSYSVLDKSSLWAALDLAPMHWRRSLRTMLQQLNKL